jgi:hypothetical protein
MHIDVTHIYFSRELLPSPGVYVGGAVSRPHATGSMRRGSMRNFTATPRCCRGGGRTRLGRRANPRIRVQDARMKTLMCLWTEPMITAHVGRRSLPWMKRI